jgi:tetratricopeptide (TPR) repeat protein
MYRFELKDSDYSFNASLDPFVVLKRMGFTEASIYQEGNIIRIHCPVHRDLVRKSMIIDKEEKTFKCQYSQCDAYEGGLLIELVALYYDCDLEEVTKNLFGEEDKSTDLLFRGEMYINKGMHEEALPYLEQAVQMDPRNEITRSKLAALLLELGRKDDAYREYLAAAESYGVRGELDKTLSIYNILIVLQPGAVKARKELAFLFARMGRPDAAAEQLKWVVDFYMKYGQVRGAQEAIGTLLEMDPSNGMAHFLMGLTHKDTGKKGAAADSFEKAAELLLLSQETRRARLALDEAREMRPGGTRIQELYRELEALEAAQAAQNAPLDQEEEDFDAGSFIEWLDQAELPAVPQATATNSTPHPAIPEGQPPAADGSLDQVAVGSVDLRPSTSVPKIETSEISPEDRRVALCLNDMRDLAPEQLERMRQQLIGMFTDVRKTYEDGLLSEWEMRTIKDFYKAFCVAVDQYRRQ